MRRSRIPTLSLFAVLLTFTASADEGMWTLDNFPKTVVRERYDVDVSDTWLHNVQCPSVRAVRSAMPYESYRRGNRGTSRGPEGSPPRAPYSPPRTPRQSPPRTGPHIASGLSKPAIACLHPFYSRTAG